MLRGATGSYSYQSRLKSVHVEFMDSIAKRRISIQTARKGRFRLRFDPPKRHVIRALEPAQEVCGDIVKCVLSVIVATLLFSSLPCSDASALHWITRLGHTNCDNHPVAETHAPGLIQRSEQNYVDAPLHFEVERPFASHSLLTLVVCDGEVHILPNPHPDQLRVVVHLGASLRHELIPGRFLQEFVVGQKDADVEWKLPASSRPVIDMYVPEQTALDLQLGRTNLLVKGVRGDKEVNAGKGTVRLDVSNGDSEYHSITVDVAMGSFADLRTEDSLSHHFPFHQELPGRGDATAHLQMAMGRIEIGQEN
jgi:hypothetical protein